MTATIDRPPTTQRAGGDEPPPPPGGGGGGGRPPHRSDRVRAERRLAFLLCAPAVIVMIAVTAYPILYAIWLSLQRVDLRFPAGNKFVGLKNYGDVFTSRLFWGDLATTLLIGAVSVVIELVIGMALAIVMDKALVARRLIRSTVLIPYAIITVVAALAWQFAFTPGKGFVNQLLGSNTNFFGHRGTALAVIIATEVWKTTPFMSLLLLAGLALVPTELHEAAKVDGATRWQRFTRITLPLMKPAILVAVLFRLLDALRIMDTIYIQTQGSVGTESLSILGYNQLLDRLNLGIGSAVSVVIFLLVIVVAVLFVKGLGTSLAQQRGET